MTNTGIYIIRNTINGKLYVGSAVHIRNRWSAHLSSLRAGKHHSVKLQRSWNKHGEKSFIFEMIEDVEIPEDLIRREQVWIDHYKANINGYNISPTAGNCLGVKHSAETRKKVSEAGIGRTESAETRAKIGAAHRGKVIPQEMRDRLSEVNSNPSPERREINAAAHRGKIHSIESRQKMSASRIGVTKSESHRAAIGAAHKGKTISIETREKISAAQKGHKRGNGGRVLTEDSKRRMSLAKLGKKLSPEHAAKARVTMLGKKMPEEAKAKIAEANRHRVITDETRAKMSASQKARRARSMING